MLQKKLLFFIVVLLLSSGACFSSNFVPEEKKFPLEQSNKIFADETIYQIGVSDSFLIFNTGSSIQLVDAETFEVSSKLDVYSPSIDSQILFAGDYAVLMSNEEVLLIKKEGKTTLNLNKKRANNIKLVAALDKYVYIIRGNWVLEAYDILENKIIWETEIGRSSGTGVYNELSSDIVYVVTYSSVRAFQNSTGDLLWEENIDTDMSTYANGIIYLVTDDSTEKEYNILAFDTSAREVIWQSEYKYSLPIYVRGVSILQDTLVLNAHYDLIAFDILSGSFMWETSQNDAGFYSKPILLGDNLYIKASNKVIYAISLDVGLIIGSVQLEEDSFWGITPSYEADSGVYLFREGIVFKTKDSIVYYIQE